MNAINRTVDRSLAREAFQAASIEIPPPVPSSVPTPTPPEMPPSGPEPTPPEIDEPPLQPNEPIREPNTPPPMAAGPSSREWSSAGPAHRPLRARPEPRLRECSLNHHVVYH
jgi:hypothetical protein